MKNCLECLELAGVTLVTRRSSSDCLHVLSCYVSTFATSREVKDKFFHVVEQVLSAIPSTENFVMLGDFNVGSRMNDGI